MGETPTRQRINAIRAEADAAASLTCLAGTFIFSPTLSRIGAIRVVYVTPCEGRNKSADDAHPRLKYDEHLYRERHLIECFINKIKHYRRVFSRFDKLSKNYLGFLSFVSALVW